MRNQVASLIGLVLAGTFVAAPVAADDAPKPSSCAVINSIDDWKIVDRTTIIVSTGPTHNYKVTFLGTCPHLKWSILARVDTKPSTGMCLSAGDTIVFGRGGAPRHFEEEERCVVKSVERMEPAQAPN